MARKGDRAEVVIAAIDKVAAPIRKINRHFEEMMKPINKVKRNLRSLSKELKLDKLGRGLKSLGRGLRNIGMAAIVGVGAAIAGVSKLATSGDNLAKLTKRIKFNAQAFQELEFAANISGVSSEAFRKGVVKLVKNVGELKAGTGTMVTILDKVAPAFKQQLLGAESSAEAFEMMLDFINRLKDPMKQAAAANMAFGRGGMVMINMAAAGTEEINRLREEAVSLGIVMSGEQLDASEDMVDTFTRLKASITGVARVIGFELFPIVEEISIGIKDWVVANKELLTSDVKDGIHEMGVQLKIFWKWLDVAVPKMLEFVDSIGGFKTIAIALGAVLSLSLLAPLVAVVATIGAIPAALIAASAAILIFSDQIADALNPVKWLQGLVGEAGVSSLQASHAAQLALGSPVPIAALGPANELSGSIRVELAGAEPSSVQASFGSNVSADIAQGSNMPVE